MAKKKIETIAIDSVNGSRLPEPKKYDVYYDGFFFCYIPDELVGSLPEGCTTYRKERKKGEQEKTISVIKGTSPESIHTTLYRAIENYHSTNKKEKKIIAFKFKFNSNKNYFNHTDKISFAETPALSLWWRIYYHITFPDGREKIFSHPFKGYGNICSPKFDKYVEQYENKWIDWTQEREEFFQQATDSMELMIEKISGFFAKDSDEIALLVDSKAGLLSYNPEKKS
jgi:hypothetical protein